MLKKFFVGTGCGFREKVPEFSPRSLQGQALFDVKKVQKCYPTRFLDLFSKPYLVPSAWH
ncbi:MAG: hypothetical protein EWV74_03185 [Microcystis wesenbergii Mw_QC_S_20081001_S30]|nr:MAG: hypothetical protein EWV74_03185 [Microcystis wesenbergii Mw_QC_S_20081001_S30]